MQFSFAIFAATARFAVSPFVFPQSTPGTRKELKEVQRRKLHQDQPQWWTAQ